MEQIKWSEKVTNEQVLYSIGEKRTLLNNILRRKANWIGHILRRNCLLHNAIEGQMTEVERVGRRTQLLDDLRNRRRHWELKIETLETRVYHEHKKEIQVIFRKSKDLLTNSIRDAHRNTLHNFIAVS